MEKKRQHYSLYKFFGAVIFVNSLIRDIFSYDFSQCTTTTHEKKIV